MRAVLRGLGTEGSTGGESERTDQKRTRKKDPARQQCSVTIRESFSCDDFGRDSEISSIKHMTTRKRNFSLTAFPCHAARDFESTNPSFSAFFFLPPHPVTPNMLSSRSQFPGAAIPVIMCVWRVVPGASGLDAWRGTQPEGGGRSEGPGWDMALDGWMGRRKAPRKKGAGSTSESCPNWGRFT